MLTHAIKQKYNADIIVPEWDPVVGALFFAFEKNNISLDDDLTRTIINTYLSKRTA